MMQELYQTLQDFARLVQCIARYRAIKHARLTTMQYFARYRAKYCTIKIGRKAFMGVVFR